MSWLYTYYLCYKKDDKLYPLAPFDAAGEWHEVLSKSRSFASDLYESFKLIPKDMMSDELRRVFHCEEDNDPDPFLSYLPLSSLPSGRVERSRYCLTESVMEYLRGESGCWEEDLEYNSLSVEEYAVKAEAEIRHGRPRGRKREDRVEYTCRDYTLFTWIPRHTPEFESWIIRMAADPYLYSDIAGGSDDIYVVLQQG